MRYTIIHSGADGAIYTYETRRRSDAARLTAHSLWYQLLSVTGGLDTANGWEGYRAIDAWDWLAEPTLTISRHGESITIRRDADLDVAATIADGCPDYLRAIRNDLAKAGVS